MIDFLEELRRITPMTEEELDIHLRQRAEVSPLLHNYFRIYGYPPDEAGWKRLVALLVLDNLYQGERMVELYKSMPPQPIVIPEGKCSPKPTK